MKIDLTKEFGAILKGSVMDEDFLRRLPEGRKDGLGPDGEAVFELLIDAYDGFVKIFLRRAIAWHLSTADQVVVTVHKSTGYVNASIFKAGGTLRLLPFGEMLERLRGWEALASPAPRITDGTHFPTWAPEECNVSAGKEGSRVVGDKEAVSYCCRGNHQVRSSQVVFWTYVDDRIPVCVCLEPVDPPFGWRPTTSYEDYDADGPRRVRVDPPVGFTHGKGDLRRGMGSRSSYDYTHFWTEWDDFRRDAYHNFRTAC